MAPRVCARWRGLLPALGGAGLQDQGLSSAVSIINWLLARRHLHTVDGSHRLCDRRAARQCRLRRRAWEWACRCSCSLKLLRRSSLSERLFAFARERTHLFCTVIDSERYRMCTASFRTLHGPKYSRARNSVPVAGFVTWWRKAICLEPNSRGVCFPNRRPKSLSY